MVFNTNGYSRIVLPGEGNVISMSSIRKIKVPILRIERRRQR